MSFLSFIRMVKPSMALGGIPGLARRISYGWPAYFRRPGYYNPGLFYLGSSLFSWGKVLAVIVLAALLINPSLLDSSYPAWRGSLGYLVLGVALLALFFNVFRFFKVVIVSGFWVLAICLISKELFFAPALEGNLEVAAVEQAVGKPETARERRHQEALVTSHHGGRDAMRTLEGDVYSSSTFMERINPVRIVGNLFARLIDLLDRQFKTVKRGTQKMISEEAANVEGAVNRAGDQVNQTLGESLDQLALPGFRSGDPELADSGLPNEVYYPPAAKKTSIKSILRGLSKR